MYEWGINMKGEKGLKVVRDIMELLKQNGIHSITVKTVQEAKNFIMYHVGVGTVIFIDNSSETKCLELEKSVISKGGTIRRINDLGDVKKDKARCSVSEVKIFGFDNFIKSINESYIVVNTCKNVKTVVIIFLKKCESIIFDSVKENIESIMVQYGEVEETEKSDISFIFIEEDNIL